MFPSLSLLPVCPFLSLPSDTWEPFLLQQPSPFSKELLTTLSHGSIGPMHCLSKGVVITEQGAPKGEGPVVKGRKQGEGAWETVGAPSCETSASRSVSLFKFNSPQGDQVLGNPVTLTILTRH